MNDENQLTIRRTFDASRERVYQAFTDPEELEQWFVPEGMTGEVHTLEPEPGGAFAMSWMGDEHSIENEGTYLEVVENERIVSVEETDQGGLRLAYEFRDVEDGTEIVLTQDFPGPVPEGATEGWAGILDNLAEHLSIRGVA